MPRTKSIGIISVHEDLENLQRVITLEPARELSPKEKRRPSRKRRPSLKPFRPLRVPAPRISEEDFRKARRRRRPLTLAEKLLQAMGKNPRLVITSSRNYEMGLYRSPVRI